MESLLTPTVHKSTAWDHLFVRHLVLLITVAYRGTQNWFSDKVLMHNAMFGFHHICSHFGQTSTLWFHLVWRAFSHKSSDLLRSNFVKFDLSLREKMILMQYHQIDATDHFSVFQQVYLYLLLAHNCTSVLRWSSQIAPPFRSLVLPEVFFFCFFFLLQDSFPSLCQPLHP